MYAVNAPQPSAGSAPAEVFDSTIAPAAPTISSVGLPGPNNVEAPAAAGELNTVDLFLHKQYIINTTFGWSISQDPGTLLFSIPIHPTTCHPWLEHLAKMYNTWAGGIDFAVKVAGTGFHAGAIMVARIPPNIKPSRLITPTQVSAFEYKIIDPKMLEVEIQSVMDQRPVKYHYNPLNVANELTFGGYLAVYVAMPLTTSATGVSQINVQIYTRPAMNFVFSQIKPIDVGNEDNITPYQIEDALSFYRRDFKVGNTYSNPIKRIIVNSAAKMKMITWEQYNLFGFNGQTPTSKPWEAPLNATFEVWNDADKEELKWDADNVVADWNNTAPYSRVMAENSNFFFQELWEDRTKRVIPWYFYGRGALEFTLYKKISGQNFYWTITFYGEFRQPNANDKDTYRTWKQAFDVKYWKNSLPDIWYELKNSTFNIDKVTGFIDFKAKKMVKNIRFQLLDTAPFYTPPLKSIAPTIPESIVTFDTSPHGDQGIYDSRNVSLQTNDLCSLLRTLKFGALIDRNESLIFELVDTTADLPVDIFRLNYEGYLTAPLREKEDVIYNLGAGTSYKLRYTGRRNKNDPIAPPKMLAQTAKNFALSRIMDSYAPRIKTTNLD